MIDTEVDKLYIKDLRFSKAEDPKGLYGVFKEILKEMGISRAWDPDKIIINFDEQPARSTRRAEGQELAKQFAEEHGATVYEGCQGDIGHNVMVERDMSGPGEFIVGADSHSCTYGTRRFQVGNVTLEELKQMGLNMGGSNAVATPSSRRSPRC